MTLCRNWWVFLVIAGALTLAASDSRAQGDPLRLRAGDLVKLKVVGYEDLGGEYLVGSDGLVDLPLLGELQIAGLTSRDAEARLREEYWKHLLTQPQVMVEGRYRVSVLGQVRLPGVYHINGTEKLTDLVALAGGPTDYASLGGTRLTRDGTVIKSDLKDPLARGDTVIDIGIRSGDILYIPRKRMIWDWRTWSTIVSSVYMIVMIYDRSTD